jgi:hypothetical protein
MMFNFSMNCTEKFYTASACRMGHRWRAGLAAWGADVKTISGAKIEHHSRAAECSDGVPPMSSWRPSSLRTKRAALKRAMVSTFARLNQEEFVNFMPPT